MPTPKAVAIELTEMQQKCLEEIAKQTTNAYRLVRRASIILGAAAGESNSQLSRQWQLDRNQVREWRARWMGNAEKFKVCEEEDATGGELRKQILGTFEDRQRPGVPMTFGPEQVVQIVAIACEEPQASGRPVERWTARELADEAMKRGIVTSVSASSVRRFLGGGATATAPESILAQRQSRKP